MSRPRQDLDVLGRALVEPEAGAPEQITPGHRARFDVHRNNVAHARVDSLRSIFPAVEQLVGEPFFAALAGAFIEKHPPTSPLLFRYGGAFPDFISAFPPAETVPYLADVARIEWLRLQAYHASDAEPLGLDALARIAPEDLPAVRLGLHPSVGIVRSNWPIFSIWMNSRDPEKEHPVDMGDGQAVLTVRIDLQVQTSRLSVSTDLFLGELQKGAPLGQAAEIAHAGAADFDLGAELGVLFKNQLVVSTE